MMIPNIKAPQNIKFQVLEALKFYPELKNTTINFVYAAIKTTMAARPNALPLLCKRRIYSIYINNKKSNQFGILFNEVPEKAQIGLIAHELAHIVDYENKSIFQITKTGIQYLFSKQRQAYEREIDISTVEHGAGWHLFEYTKYILHSSNVSDKYRNFIKKYYLQANEIEELINEINNDNHRKLKKQLKIYE